MDGDMDVLAGGSGELYNLYGVTFQLVWCENEGGSNPEFVAHVLLGGANVVTFDVLVSKDAVLVMVAAQYVPLGAKMVQLKWFRSVPGMSIAHASADLVDGPVIEFWQLVIAPIIDADVNVIAFDFFSGNLEGVTWCRINTSSPPGLTSSLVMAEYAKDLGVGDVDGEHYVTVVRCFALLEVWSG
jgi:hypothetical protein